MSITRRSLAKSAAAVAASVAIPAAAAEPKPRKKVYGLDGKGPTARYPYSPAVSWGSILFLAGKASGTAPDPTDIRSCTQHVLEAFAAELKNAGSSMENVLKATIYLQNPDDVAGMNEVFAKHFPKDPPARTTIITRTPHPTLIEMDLIAGI